MSTSCFGVEPLLVNEEGAVDRSEGGNVVVALHRSQAHAVHGHERLERVAVPEKDFDGCALAKPAGQQEQLVADDDFGVLIQVVDRVVDVA